MKVYQITTFPHPRQPFTPGAVVSTRLGHFTVVRSGHGRVILERDGYQVSARRADILGVVSAYSTGE